MAFFLYFMFRPSIDGRGCSRVCENRPDPSPLLGDLFVFSFLIDVCMKAIELGQLPVDQLPDSICMRALGPNGDPRNALFR
jgi:hypothetical protein